MHTASMLSEIFGRPDLLIDLVIVLLLGAVHTVSWWGLRLERATGDRKEAGTAIRGAAVAGITVVGILVPLSILASQLRSKPQSRSLSGDAVVSLFVGDVWLLLSLACGLYVLWVAAMRAYEKDNVIGDKSVGIVIGFRSCG